MPVRLGYRIRQFWQALTARRATAEPPDLPPGLAHLFWQMPPADRAHGLRACQSLSADGVIPADLVIATLLHDVGKSAHPIHLWDRVLYVLAGRLAYGWLQRVTAVPAAACWSGLVALHRHAEQGARLVAAAGGTPEAVDLIRHHHADPDSLPWPPEKRRLLQALQRADDLS